MKKRIYISAPITNYQIEEREIYFQKVEDIIKDIGHIPVNPMKNGLSYEASHDEHMKVDLEMLESSDIVIFLGNYKSSKGCMKELEAAQEQYKIILESPTLEQLLAL